MDIDNGLQNMLNKSTWKKITKSAKICLGCRAEKQNVSVANVTSRITDAR